MEPAETPGQGEMPISAFIRNADALPRNVARLNKEQIELQYETTRRLLKNEALLAKFCALQFDISKKIRIAPDAINDMIAPRIARVLAQLDSLLALSLLPDIELLVTQSFLNTGDGQSDAPLFAGYLPPSAIREMEIARSIVTIYTYLFFAEAGLFTILAHHTPNKKFEPFRAVKREYAGCFLAALPPLTSLSRYQNRSGAFEWSIWKPAAPPAAKRLPIFSLLSRSSESSAIFNPGARLSHSFPRDNSLCRPIQ